MKITEKEYVPAPGSRLSKEQAKEVGTSLDAILEVHGDLDPKIVVEEARDDASPLHKYFTWDDTEAAEQYRMVEARKLIGAVRIRIERGRDQTPLLARAYLHTKLVDKGTYLPVDVIMSDAEMRAELLAKAMIDLQNFKRRYGVLSELAQIFDAISKVETKLVKGR